MLLGLRAASGRARYRQSCGCCWRLEWTNCCSASGPTSTARRGECGSRTMCAAWSTAASSWRRAPRPRWQARATSAPRCWQHARTSALRPAGAGVHVWIGAAKDVPAGRGHRHGGVPAARCERAGHVDHPVERGAGGGGPPHAPGVPREGRAGHPCGGAARRRAGPAAPGSSARVPARRERYERAERPGTAGRRRARAGLARPARSAWHARARAPACPPLCSPRGVATDPRTRCALQVKLLKCLVDNIVVDISFDTLNGLCTLAFLEVVDRHVGRAHLFKRSIILARPARGRTLRLAAAPGAPAGSRGRPYASRSPLDADRIAAARWLARGRERVRSRAWSASAGRARVPGSSRCISPARPPLSEAVPAGGPMHNAEGIMEGCQAADREVALRPARR